MRATDINSGLASYTPSDGVTVLPPSGTAVDLSLVDGKPCPDGNGKSMYHCSDSVIYII